MALDGYGVQIASFIDRSPVQRYLSGAVGSSRGRRSLRGLARAHVRRTNTCRERAGIVRVRLAVASAYGVQNAGAQAACNNTAPRPQRNDPGPLQNSTSAGKHCRIHEANACRAPEERRRT